MKSVLLVEDEQSLGDVLAMILNGCGFSLQPFDGVFRRNSR